MQDYQRAFIDFALECGALRFGEFTLKSGRLSPYFFNIGLFNTGAAVSRLGQYYAAAVTGSGCAPDMLFGPAYKGITLAVTTAVALARDYDRDLPFAFNRKEKKDHGEGGVIVGSPLQGRVLIIDDVISSGSSVGESCALIERAGAAAAGVAVALDRQERGSDDTSAVDEVRRRHGMDVVSIVGLDDLIVYLEERPGLEQTLERVHGYRRRYGVTRP